QPGGRQRDHRGVEGGLQYGAAPQRARREDASTVPGRLCTVGNRGEFLITAGPPCGVRSSVISFCLIYGLNSNLDNLCFLQKPSYLSSAISRSSRDVLKCLQSDFV